MTTLKLSLPPSSQSYSVTNGQGAISAQLESPAGRYRQNVPGATATGSLQWSVPANEYQYIRAFYHTGVNRGSDSFLIDLIFGDSTSREHTVRFEPASFSTTGFTGGTYVVAANIEVTPLARDVAADNATMDAFNSETSPRKLALPPDQQSYSAEDGVEVVSIGVEGGFARRRRDVIGSTTRIPVQWTVNADEYDYLQAFYYTGTNTGADAFNIDLMIDNSTLDEYSANFVVDTFETSSTRGDQYTVSAELEVRRIARDANFDNSLIAVINAAGVNARNLMNTLEKVANEDLPMFLPPDNP
jgi:hypothetical protein